MTLTHLHKIEAGETLLHQIQQTTLNYTINDVVYHESARHVFCTL